MVGTIASILTPVVGFLSKILGPILKKFAPIIATLILSLGPQGLAGGFVRLIPYIGRFLAPLVNLGQFLTRILGPAFRVLFRGVALVFRGLIRIIPPVMRIITRIITSQFRVIQGTVSTVMRIIMTVIRVGWRIISRVFSGAVRVIGTIIRTYFTVYRTIITTVFNVIVRVIRVAWSVIRRVISGGISFIRGLFRNGFRAIQSFVSTVWTNLVAGARFAISGLSRTVQNGIRTVVNFIKGLPGKIAGMASSFLHAGTELGGKVIQGIKDGFSAAGGFASDIVGKIRSAINSMLGLPRTIGKGPLKFTIPSFATGGVAPGGAALVGEKGPEIVTLPRGSRVHSNQESRGMAQNESRLPKTVILRIGARDFVAYVTEVADKRISARDSLEWRGF
jgi:phage-related protein